MKRLLLIPALGLPLAFLSCHKTPEIPKIPEVIRNIPLEDFDHFPTPVAPVAPKAAPRHVVKHTPKPPVPAPVPQVYVKHQQHTPKPVKDPVEYEPVPLPPQKGTICIFPLNMVPHCTPGPNQ